MDKTKELADLDLIIMLCCTEDDQQLFKEFVNRFYSELHAECLKIANARKLDKHLATQITHDTFEKVRKYKSFKATEVKKADLKKAILIYLLKISRNLFIDYHNKEKKQDDKNFYASRLAELTGTDDHLSDKELKKMKDAAVQTWNKLNSKEQLVLLNDIEYKRLHKYLPDHVTEDLANQLGIKKDTIRKIRERALVKIKKGLDESYQ